MKERCNEQFKNVSGEFNSNEMEIEWYNCNNEADKWKIDHMP